jgi:hypothetical protein
MIQRTCGSGFVQQEIFRGFFRDRTGRQHLDGHVALQNLVSRTVYRAHASLTQFGDHAVIAKHFANVHHRASRWKPISFSPIFSNRKFYGWRERYGKVNEHNGWIPVAFHQKNPLEGYRRLAFMILDADIVAVSPASVWRVPNRAGLLRKWNGKPSKKGTGFEQPPQPHQHRHIDVSYLNVCATFYYLCSILDDYAVSWCIGIFASG